VYRVSKRRIRELKEQIAALKSQWPAHSIPPAMIEQLDDLEEELEKALGSMPAEVQQKPLWTCPECGRQFVNANTFHSCGYYDIEDHFVGKSRLVREIFDEFTVVVEGFGPVTVYAQKTRIVFQVRTRFAAVVPRQRWLTGHIWLKRRAEHPRIHRVEMYIYRDHGHIFRLNKLEDLDNAFQELLHEAYALGSR
jgi:hypothetical protein